MTFPNPHWPERTFMATLPGEDQNALLKAGTRVEFAYGDYLLRQGEPGTTVFLLLQGFVKVVGANDEGDRAILGIRAPGDLVGEFAVLDGGVRAAHVQASGAVVAVRIWGQAFLDYLLARPPVLLNLARGVIRKLRTATDRRIEIRGYPARVRLARVLCELADNYGVARNGGIRFPFPLTQVELGSLASIGASTAEKILSQFQQARIVASDYRNITILDMAALRAEALR